MGSSFGAGGSTLLLSLAKSSLLYPCLEAPTNWIGKRL